jgi:hypothetical protein
MQPKIFHIRIFFLAIILLILNNYKSATAQCKADFLTHVYLDYRNVYVNLYSTSSGNNLEYLWDFGDTALGINNTSSLENIRNLYPKKDSFTVKLVIKNGNCKDSVLKTIKTKNLPVYDGDTTVCFGNQITIGRAPIEGYSYNWNYCYLTDLRANGSYFTFTPKSAGKECFIYNKTIIIDGINYNIIDTISVNILQNTKAKAGISASICLGDSTYIGSENDTNTIYSWTSDPPGFSSNKANLLVSPFATTTYFLKAVYKPTGCVKNDTVVIKVMPDAQFTISKISDFTYSFSANDTTNSEYLWHFGDGETTKVKSVTHTYAEKDTIYKVKLFVTNTTGCSSSRDSTLIISSNPTIQLKPEFNIYPNPFTDHLLLNYTITETTHIIVKLSDITGREIPDNLDFTKQAGTFRQEFNFPGQNLSAGMYFLKITLNDQFLVKKIMKLK